MEPNTRPISYLPLSINESISVKKTILIIATIVGCIAILWPKVLYPTFFGGPIFPTNLKGQRIYDGCCDVVIDREYLLNVTNSTPEIGLFRKELKSFPRDASVSQERPNQLHPESIYQAMRERGRSIPPAPTIPIIDKNAPFRNPMPRISTPKFAAKPGVRPPMGAGSLQQPQVKGSGMGLVMPLYTIAIVIFFIYTIMKIVLKKNCPNAPYESASSNATFRTEVFQQEGARNSTKYGNSLLGYVPPPPPHSEQTLNCNEICNSASYSTPANVNCMAATTERLQQQQQQEMIQTDVVTFASKESEQLMEIEKLRKKLEETERAMAKLVNEMNVDQCGELKVRRDYVNAK